MQIKNKQNNKFAYKILINMLILFYKNPPLGRSHVIIICVKTKNRR
ncbi:hypothetical protein EJK55_1920 [Moraxella catarrhalis]|uniref:Uncharacterized protein n=1 Tax=Moraxella catarrhalis TaxID=480 RepID=A0ABY0BMN6_MORCA|nr:hypothetical protein [Moraxella phage Mcat30]RUO11997.1 hypothetical protein EJK55_1920 [Moraxella catarrhalis]RUO17452.1 hypothetical protein EJK54_1948 [Moraxella catarrhalis]